MENKWFRYYCALIGILFISGIFYINNKGDSISENRKDFMVWKELMGDKAAYAFFYDKEPAGTRSIRHSDQIVRSSLHSLYLHFGVDHAITPGTYTAGQGDDYDEAAGYGVHKEGSAKIFYQSSAPGSSEEGRCWVDSDTKTVRVANDSGAYVAMSTEEVVTARGSMSDLDARLDVLTNDNGTFKAQNINLGGYRVLMAATPPTSGRELATKSYADSIVGAGGLHAASHTDGTDDIQNATNSQKGLMTAAYATSVESYATDIATNTTDIATNTTDIATNTSNISANSTSIDAYANHDGVYPVSKYTAGSTTDGIQEAIDAANADGGGTVWLAAGDYTCDNDIVLYPNVSIEGDNWDTVVASSSPTDVKWKFSVNTITYYSIAAPVLGAKVATCITASDAGNFSTGDIALLYDTNDTTLPTSFYAVSSSDAASGSVVLISEFIESYSASAKIGKYTTDNSNVIIRNLHLKDVLLDINAAPNFTIEECKMSSGDSFDNLQLWKSFNVHVKDNYFFLCGMMLDDCGDVVISGNTFEVSHQGIEAAQSILCTIVGNNIKSSGNHGIYLDDSDFFAISGNTISIASVPYDAIYLDANSDSNSVVGNICPYEVIDNNGAGNRGAGNVYETCEGCTWN